MQLQNSESSGSITAQCQVIVLPGAPAAASSWIELPDSPMDCALRLSLSIFSRDCCKNPCNSPELTAYVRRVGFGSAQWLPCEVRFLELGKYEVLFAGVKPGTYELKASHGGHCPVTASASLLPLID